MKDMKGEDREGFRFQVSGFSARSAGFCCFSF